MAGSKNMVTRGTRPTMAQVRQMVNSKLTQNLEFKHLTLSSSGNVDTSGTMFPISQKIIQGDDASERSGEAITITDLDFTVEPVINNSTTFRSAFMRVILFADKFNNGNTPSTADLITTTNINSTYADEVWKTKRIQILADHTFPVGTVNGASLKVLTRNKIKMNKKVFYQGTTDAAASNGPNSIWLYAWSTETVNTPGVEAINLLRYHDA